MDLDSAGHNDAGFSDRLGVHHGACDGARLTALHRVLVTVLFLQLVMAFL